MPRKGELAGVEESSLKTMASATSSKGQPEICLQGLLRWSQRFALSERQTKVSLPSKRKKHSHQKKMAISGFHENNEELQAAMLNKGLEEGRSLLNNPQHTNSLAAEFEAMSENEVGMKT